MVRHEVNGRTSFRIYLPHAAHVELVGDFTGWQSRPIEMCRGLDDESGWWSAECEVPDGDYRFAYLVDGQYWMPDYAASGVFRNEYGKWTSNLSVAHSRQLAEVKSCTALALTPDRYAQAC